MNENEKKFDGEATPAEEVQTDAVETTAAPEEAAPETADTADESKPEAPKSKKHGKKAFMQKVHGKNFKYGSMATLITVIAIVLTILINIGATALVNRYPSLKMDMSKDNRMSLSTDLTEIVDEVAHPTKIIFCSAKESFETSYNNTLAQYVGGDSITEGTRLTSLAEKAAERNANITVQYVDMDEDPSFAKEYPNETLTSGNIIIQTEYRYRLISLNDLYQQKSDASGNATYYSNVEYVLANALISTNLDSVPMVALSTGHGETTPATLSSVLISNNFETTTVNLMTDAEVSGDVDVIVIAAPTSDFTSDQITTMENFLYNNGDYGKNVLFLFNPNREAMPNLYAFLNDWGLSVGEAGAFVMESDSAKYIQRPYLPVLTINGDDESCVKEFASSTAVGAYPVPMKVLFDYDSGVTTHTLLSTSDTSYVVPNGESTSYEPKDSDYGANAVLAYGEKYISKHNDMYYSRVGVCTSYDAMSDMLSYTGYANKNVAVTFFKYITNTLGDADSVYIEAIEFTASDMTLTQNQVNTIGLVIFTITIPVIILIIGLVVWLRRRHL